MTNSGSNPNDIFDVKKVRRLVELMKEHDLSEIDLKQGEQRVRLRRGYEPVITMPAGMMAAGAASQPSVAPSGTSSSTSTPAAANDDSKLTVIKSPMVGTFYKSA